MAIGLAALGLLAFLLGCSGTFAEPQNSERPSQCSLTGIWEDEGGYTMKIDSVSDKGVFSGVFYFDTTDWRYLFPNPLLGIQQQGFQPTFGFTVFFDGRVMQSLLWKQTVETGPLAVFVGECLVDEQGKEKLRTTWLRRVNFGSTAENWGATMTGRSTFYRSK